MYIVRNVVGLNIELKVNHMTRDFDNGCEHEKKTDCPHCQCTYCLECNEVLYTKGTNPFQGVVRTLEE